MDPATAEQMKEGQRRIWGSGDWPDFASVLQDVSDEVVGGLAVGPGDEVLDVGTGSGNAAIVAARNGARVTGLDLVPELVEAARARFAAEGLEGELVVGNAEDLPFEDSSFDLAVSIFGAMFAPRHELAAAELTRVIRPGGRVVVTGWTPEGLNGQMFGTLGAHMPPPPEGFVPPAMWGSEDHVRELFPGHGLTVACEKRMATLEYETTEGWVAHCEEKLGPTVTAKAVLEPEGKWEAARADLVALTERYNEADDGSLLAHAEYLLTTVEKAA